MLDVLIVSLGSTGGLRAADGELLASLRRAGADAEMAVARAPRPVRTLVLTDLAWALAARREAREALAREPARAVIYSTTTAALLWPRPGAIRFDALAAANRPGRHGLWQRRLERRRLGEATLLLPQDAGALAEVGFGEREGARREGVGLGARGRDGVGLHTRACGGMSSNAPGGAGVSSESNRFTRQKGGVRHRKGGVFGLSRTAFATVDTLVLPVPVEPSAPPGGQERASNASGGGRERDVAAITYTANPHKKGLDVLLAAWARMRRPGEDLYVAGVAERELARLGYAVPADGVRVTGPLPPDEYRALLRRARVYVCAARREDYGLAQLEALADGCVLVTVPSPGPYAALPLARELDSRFVSEDLDAALRIALDDPPPDYAERALDAIAPFRRVAVDRIVSSALLPRFLG